MIPKITYLVNQQFGQFLAHIGQVVFLKGLLVVQNLHLSLFVQFFPGVAASVRVVGAVEVIDVANLLLRTHVDNV